MPDGVTGAAELRDLAAKLRAAGDDGKGLRKNLYKQMNESVLPLAAEISRLAHLEPYLPNRYAEVLSADLKVRIAKSFFAANPRVEVTAQGRAHRRKLKYLDEGFINHPDWARGPRSSWRWSNGQTGGMRPGFFSDVVKEHAPEIRDRIAQAMAETAREIAG